jgi:hypothetical protein
MRAAAEPLPDDPDDSQEDETHVILVQEAPEVGIPCCETGSSMTLLIPVSRSTHRDLGLYFGGSSTWIPLSASSQLSGL